jgi:hypothetical protein
MSLKGNLQDFSLPDLLKIIEQGKKNGVLLIRCPGIQEGNIFFLEGEIKHASLDNFDGETAIYSLFHVNNGDFNFIEGEKVDKTTITSNLDQIIKEGLDRVDKWKKLTELSPVMSIWSKIKIIKEDWLSSSHGILEQKILNTISTNADRELTLGDLVNFLTEDIIFIGNSMEKLLDSGIIDISGQEDMVLYNLFLHVVNTLFKEFTSISGIKLNSEFKNKIKKIIEENKWDLIPGEEAISGNKTFFSTHQNPQLVYKNFLKELTGIINPIYGENFTERVIKDISESLPNSTKSMLKNLIT